MQNGKKNKENKIYFAYFYEWAFISKLGEAKISKYLPHFYT